MDFSSLIVLSGVGLLSVSLVFTAIDKILE